MLVFDSSAVAPGDRFDAVHEAVRRCTHPARFDPGAAGDPAGFEYRAWSTAPGAALFRASGTGMRMWRHDTGVFPGDEALVCLTVQPAGHARLTQDGAVRDLVPGALWICDMSRAYDFSWSGPGVSGSYQLTPDALGLQPCDLAEAAPRLPASPLHGVVRDHVADLLEHARAGLPLVPALHRATVDLARALVVSVLSEEVPRSLPDDEQVLWSALRTHLRRHLRERDLDEASAARALGVAPERLRRLTEGRGVVLADLVTERRVRGARADLERRGTAGGGASALPGAAVLASTAARWGFRSPGALLDALAAEHAGPGGR
ncbi:hypothetical protein NUM3379_02560 [Kineococcus sp. NUM-3379]